MEAELPTACSAAEPRQRSGQATEQDDREVATRKMGVVIHARTSLLEEGVCPVLLRDGREVSPVT